MHNHDDSGKSALSRKREYDMLKIAFSTLACPDWGWNDLLRYGPEFGYGGVEIRLLERETDLLKLPDFQPSQRPTRRRELSDAGFQICGLASSVRFDYPEKNQRKEQLVIGRAYLDLAVELDAGFVRVFGDVIPDADDPQIKRAVIENIVEGLNRLGDYAEQVGRRIVIETHGDFSDSQLMHDTLKGVQSKAVGVLWDTHHPWRFYGEELSETFERLKPWIFHTHWKDSVSQPRQKQAESAQSAATAAHNLMSGHRHADYVLFGGGEFPADECLRLLEQADYQGWYSLEWEKMWHPELADPLIALPLFPGKLKLLYGLMFPESKVR
ncbi:MAG: sugar phosphate isomerase/epimerase [Planctomycetes bacterium]|nr:sugar phosphate isomerase/epimerase [Planctomycetota bacterium]